MLPLGSAQSTLTAARAGRPCTLPMAAGADTRGCSPAPAAQDAASRSSGAHVAKGFLSSFALCLFSPQAFLCQHSSAQRGHCSQLGCGQACLGRKQGIGSAVLQTCLGRAEQGRRAELESSAEEKCS